MVQLAKEEQEEKEKRRADAAAKREEIERKELEAENLRNAPVDDSKIVEQMFGFLPEGMTGDGESVCSIVCVCLCVSYIHNGYIYLKCIC